MANAGLQGAHQLAAVDLSKEVSRTAVLLNGGASIAVLALMGQLVDKHTFLADPLYRTVTRFAIAAFLGGLSTACFYDTQFSYAQFITRGGKFWRIRYLSMSSVGSLCILASYVLFVWAAFIASSGLHQLATHLPSP